MIQITKKNKIVINL